MQRLNPFSYRNRDRNRTNWDSRYWCSSQDNEYIPVGAISSMFLDPITEFNEEGKFLMYRPYTTLQNKQYFYNDNFIPVDMLNRGNTLSYDLDTLTHTEQLKNADNTYLVNMGHISSQEGVILLQAVLDSKFDIMKQRNSANYINIKKAIKLLIASELITDDSHKKLWNSLLKYYIKPAMIEKVPTLIIPSAEITDKVFKVVPEIQFQSFEERVETAQHIPEIIEFLQLNTIEMSNQLIEERGRAIVVEDTTNVSNNSSSDTANPFS